MILQKSNNEDNCKNNCHEIYQSVKSTGLTSGKKGQKLLTSIEQQQTSIVNRNLPIQRDKIGGYRFLNNPRIDNRILIESLQDQCSRNCQGLHIIGIQDTSEYNYQHHFRRIRKDSLGIVGNNKDIGYFAHLMICFDATSCLPLGISYCQLWSRDLNRKDKQERDYKNLPIEEKESFRWLNAAEQTKTLLSSAKHLTLISDRESDIYQIWSRIPDERTDLIIRARCDRTLFEQHITISQKLDQQPIAGKYTIELKEDKRAKRSKRTAMISIKYGQVRIQKPKTLRNDKTEENYISLMVVEAKEDTATCKEGESPVHWVLLTTHAVKNVEQAYRIIEWYSFRWQIEQFFRMTKKQGIDLENSQLETAEGLQKLGIMGFASALRILQLTLARDGTVNDKVHKYFDAQEIIVLSLLDDQLKGTTKKQQNPFPKETLAWAAWIIGRLGGYSGYSSQSPPGPNTMKWGLDRFNLLKNGYLLFQQKDVYKE